MSHATDRETLKLLCKSIITRLENQKAITFPPRLRQIVSEEVYGLIGPYILTDQDLREKALQKMGARAEQISDANFTESDAFKAARSMVRTAAGDDELNGFYFQKPLKFVAESISQYLMRSSHIDDVYETDEDLEKKIVDVVKKFDPKQLH